MLPIAAFPHRPADIGHQIPKPLIAEAGGAKNFITFDLGPGLKVHRRCDDQRVRSPVNGRRGFETQKFWSIKAERFVHSEGRGELPLYHLAEVHSPILTYRDQHDIIEIEDDDGRCWAIPDIFALVRYSCEPVWIEGKGNRILVRGQNCLPGFIPGLRQSVRTKLRRIQRAFRVAGLTYVVANQDWCASQPVSEVASLAFWNRKKTPSESECSALLELLSRGDSTVAECAIVFSDRDCPSEWVCAAMARGLIEIDLRKPFSLSSAVSLPPNPFWMTRRRA
jgi:hypothetical protein